MTALLKSTNISLTVPALLTSTNQLLTEADELLQFEFPTEIDIQQVRTHLRKIDTTQRLLTLQLTHLRSKYDQWEEVVRNLS